MLLDEGKKKREGVFIYLSLILLYFTNFMNVGHYAIFALFPIVIIMFFRTGAKINIQQFMLLLFCSVFGYFLNAYQLRTPGIIFITVVFPSVFYFLGKYLAHKSKKVTMHVLVLTILTITGFGFTNVYTSNVIDLLQWRGVESVWGYKISATGINAYISLGLSLIPMLFIKDSKRKKLLYLIIFGLSVYSMTKMGSRTGILIIALSIASYFLILKRVTKKSIFVLVIGAFAAMYYYKNAQGSLFLSRTSGMSFADDPRIKAWDAAWKGLFLFPSGGKQTVLPLQYAHNLWLDVGFETGIIPFLLLAIFSLLVLLNVVKLNRIEIPYKLKVLFLCLSSAFVVTFFMEPVLEGWIFYFNAFCLYAGLLNGTISTSNVIEKEKKANTRSIQLLRTSIVCFSTPVVLMLALLLFKLI